MTSHSIVRNVDDVIYDNFADYGGSDRKNGILLDGHRWMIKFQEHESTRNPNQTSNVNNVIAEYLSSHIAAMLNLPVHETLLVSIDGDMAVACKNFEEPNTRHIDFDRFLHRHFDSKDVKRHPSLGQIETVLRSDRQLGPAYVRNIVSFWDMFVFDALVGNYDRHGGNWGYLARANSNVALQSPLYDNASTFYPSLSEESMPLIQSDHKEVARRVLLFPNSAIELAGNRLNYHDVLMAGWDGPVEAVSRLVPRIDPNAICGLIETLPMSDVRKRFYQTMIRARYALLLMPALEATQSGVFDQKAAKRLSEGKPFTAKDFEHMWERVPASIREGSMR